MTTTMTTDAESIADGTDPEDSWRELSSCRGMDPDLFFSGGGASHKAKKVCIDCPVRDLCLALALENDERFGIWGGLTRAERAKLRKSSKGATTLDEEEAAAPKTADPAAA